MFVSGRLPDEIFIENYSNYYFTGTQTIFSCVSSYNLMFSLTPFIFVLSVFALI